MGKITLGMYIVRADGRVGVVTGWKVVPGGKTMYNLEVQRDHTFVVGVGQWVVHNKCGPVNSKGEPYPQVTDPRTGQPIPFPDGDIKIVPQVNRVVWDKTARGAYLAFGRSLGDRDLLLMDTSRCTVESKECYVIDGDSESLPKEWSPIARSFGEWLDYLVVAQGAKYWRWFPVIVGR